MFVRAEICTGCRMCELICSLYKEGQIDPASARIHIERHILEGLTIPRVCLNCKDPPCIKACHRKALQKDPATGWVTLIQSRCNNCTLCIAACPYDAFTQAPDGRVLLCDLCNGDPQCVQVCSIGAIKYLDRDKGRQTTLPASV